MVQFPEVRNQEEIKADFQEAREELKNFEKGSTEWYKQASKIRGLLTEYHTEVLEDYSSETKAVRLMKNGDRYFCQTYELIGGASMQGYLPFGGTEDESVARGYYEKETTGGDLS